VGAKYTSQSTSGYNSGPPSDDGTQSASNLITWAGIKTKLADVLKTFGEAINTALVATLNLSARAVSSNDPAVAGDHWRTIEISGGATFTILDAATAAAGYVVTICNVGTSNSKITRATAGDFINGVAQDLLLPPGCAVTLKVNASANGYITDSARNVDLSIVEGRLTLTTGTPVTTADVTSATTVYFTPYKGNRIALFDGTNQWNIMPFSEVSVAVPNTSSTVYDVFAYNNSGAVALEVAAWTSDTARLSALATQNGVYVRLGASTRRYLGTFRTTTGINGQTEDSLTRRYVWNYYNRVERPMRVLEATNSWNYATATIRQANAPAANQLEMVIGVSEDEVHARVDTFYQNSNAGGGGAVFVGLDSITAAASGFISPQTQQQAAAAGIVTAFGEWVGYPGVGRHYLAWLEVGNGTGTQTWFGDNNAPTTSQSGISGRLLG
jgi:hypothetical protein